MAKGLVLSLLIGVVALSGSLLLTHYLDSQDTSLNGFLSGLMLDVFGGETQQLIRVNLYNHSIALYEGGKLYKMARVAGTGNPYNSTATPTGEFRILSKETQHISRASGVGLIMPLSMRFFGGYYFHDIPLTRNGVKIDTKYSHGCIRLPSDLAAEMFQWTHVGAYVQIYNSQLVRSETAPMVYLLTEDGFRQPIATAEAFIAHGYHWEDVVTIPDVEVAGLPLGPTIQ